MDEPSRELVAAALAAAVTSGIAVNDPVVLHQRHGLVVHLRPSPVVARVARTASAVRPALATAAEAATFARHLFHAGAPVVRPVAPAPFTGKDGVVVTLWELLEASVPLDPVSAGSALRVLHRRAASFTGHLRGFDPRVEAVALCNELERNGFDEPAAIIRRAVDRLELPVGSTPQPIHGDAHLGNVIATADGPVWIDLEDVCVGPREWDLACLLHRGTLLAVTDDDAEAALSGYGDHDRAVVDALAAAVMVWIAPWAVYADSLDGTVNEWTTRRLDWLVRRFGRP